MPNEPTDFELLERWAQGEQAAADEIVARYFDALHRFFRNKVADGAEDLAQQALLACVKGKDRFSQKSSFRTYLFAAAHNILKREFARRTRQHQPFDSSMHCVYDSLQAPSKIVAAKQDQRILLEAFRRIPLDNQIVLELFYWEDLTGPQIAQIVGIPEGTVRGRLRRGLEQLRSVIEELASGEALDSTQTHLEDWARALRDLE